LIKWETETVRLVCGIRKKKGQQNEGEKGNQKRQQQPYAQQRRDGVETGKKKRGENGKEREGIKKTHTQLMGSKIHPCKPNRSLATFTSFFSLPLVFPSSVRMYSLLSSPSLLSFPLTVRDGRTNHALLTTFCLATSHVTASEKKKKEL
jgi:hypothetical protein